MLFRSSRLIYALGIRHVGEKAAYVLAKYFMALDNLAKSGREDLDAIYEVGPVVSSSIVEYFSQSSTKKLIGELKSAGLNFKEADLGIKATALSGKKIVFTGELKDYSRSQAEELTRSLGGNVSSSVIKNTDFLVIGENPGSKYDKAIKLGVMIIHEKEFKEMSK